MCEIFKQSDIDFYTNILGLELEIFNGGRYALNFGNQKINLHQKGKEIEPKAYLPTCGSLDICLITKTDLDIVKQKLIDKDIEIIQGIVERRGALGKIKSLYLRDPDKNLIEISKYE